METVHRLSNKNAQVSRKLDAGKTKLINLNNSSSTEERLGRRQFDTYKKCPLLFKD